MKTQFPIRPMARDYLEGRGWKRLTPREIVGEISYAIWRSPGLTRVARIVELPMGGVQLSFAPVQ